jgi:hypothetical protein
VKPSLFQEFTMPRLFLSVLTLALPVAGLARAEDGPKNLILPKCVLIIRHGEKTGEKGDFHLSRRGQERADVLHGLFENSKERPEPFPSPDFIFAASNDNSSYRPVETVTPLAKRLKLTIHDKFDSKLPNADSSNKTPAGTIGLRDELFGNSKYAAKTILVSWRHKSLPALAKALKAADAPATWEDKVFDRVWQIEYDDKGMATFRDRPQMLLPGDSQK